MGNVFPYSQLGTSKAMLQTSRGWFEEGAWGSLGSFVPVGRIRECPGLLATPCLIKNHGI